MVLHCLQRERFVAFLKTFKKYFARSYEDMCGIALEIVQLRITLSLETQPLCFQTLNLDSKRSKDNHDVRPVWPALKQPSNKRHQSQIKKIRRSEEACKARSEAPLELGAKNIRCARRANRWILLQINTAATLLDIEGFNLKTIWHGLVTLLPFERLAGSKTQKGDPGKS